MSGDFVQRGEPAILDKWLRAEHALKAGADLVVEIPTLFCLGNASQYASASVRMLEALGCDTISFGSGLGDPDVVCRVANVLELKSEEIGTHISSMIKEGKSYPQARSEAYRALRRGSVGEADLERELAVLSEPNDILAVEYIANMKRAYPLVIKREGSYHEGKRIRPAKYKSAEYVRSIISAGGTGTAELSKNVPGHVFDTFDTCRPVFPDDCFDLLRYAVMSADADTIDCPSGGEGLGNLLKKAVNEASDYNDLVLRVKSKRYTYTRISRLCMQTLLGITRGKFDLSGPGYIRVLGHNDKGRALLAERRNNSGSDEGSAAALPVITNINKERERLEASALEQLSLDIHASRIYSLISGEDRPAHAEQRMKPVMIDH